MNQKNAAARANPTVKPQPTSNRRNLKNWELRFGLMPLVGFMGLVCGSLVVAFYFGFISGQRVGLENAQSLNLANEPRIPLGREDQGAGADEGATDLYAKLSEHPKAAKPETDSTAKTATDLSTVKSIEEEPPVLALKEAPPINGQAALTEPPAAAQANPAEGKPESLVAALGDPTNPKNDGKGTQAASDKGEGTAKLGAVKEKEAAPPAESQRVTEKAEVKIAPVEEKAPTATLVRKTLNRGWYAQVAAPRKLKDADDLAKKLRASGFPVLIENAKVNGEEYFRVVVGPEESREQTERLAAQLKRESYLRGDPFVRAVK